jgi:hypothetical protein
MCHRFRIFQKSDDCGLNGSHQVEMLQMLDQHFHFKLVWAALAILSHKSVTTSY